MLINLLRGLITPLMTTHEPSSKEPTKRRVLVGVP